MAAASLRSHPGPMRHDVVMERHPVAEFGFAGGRIPFPVAPTPPPERPSYSAPLNPPRRGRLLSSDDGGELQLLQGK
jgi:hypothetical protein